MSIIHVQWTLTSGSLYATLCVHVVILLSWYWITLCMGISQGSSVCSILTVGAQELNILPTEIQYTNTMTLVVQWPLLSLSMQLCWTEVSRDCLCDDVLVFDPGAYVWCRFVIPVHLPCQNMNTRHLVIQLYTVQAICKIDYYYYWMINKLFWW